MVDPLEMVIFLAVFMMGVSNLYCCLRARSLKWSYFDWYGWLVATFFIGISIFPLWNADSEWTVTLAGNITLAIMVILSSCLGWVSGKSMKIWRTEAGAIMVKSRWWIFGVWVLLVGLCLSANYWSLQLTLGERHLAPSLLGISMGCFFLFNRAAATREAMRIEVTDE